MKKFFTLLLASLGAANAFAGGESTTTGKVELSIGGRYSYSASGVTYSYREYLSDGVEKMDVTVPSFTLENTVMGDLTLGSYIVSGLVYDAEKGGYYRDYKDDNLSVHFTAASNGVASMDNDYTFNSQKDNNILVVFGDNGEVSKIVNNFQMGAMPFPITSTFTPGSSSAVKVINAGSVELDGKAYNLLGQQVDDSYKGIVIIGGKKVLRK